MENLKSFIGVVMIVSLPFLVTAASPFHEDRTAPGVLESRGYPNPYPREVKDSWSFERKSGIWAVVFDDVDIEKTDRCKDDYLLVRDPSQRRDLIRACGDNIPDPVFSSGPKILLSFHSDGLNEGKGFRIRVLHGTSRDTLESQLKPPTTKVEHKSSEPVAFTQDQVTIMWLSITLVWAIIGSMCLGGWLYYHQYRRKGQRCCCACSAPSTGKECVVQVEPKLVVNASTRYVKKGRPKDPPVDAKGGGGGGNNVYLPMHSSDNEQQTSGRPSNLGQTTTVNSKGQLPLHHTTLPTQTSAFEEVKFIGVM